MNFGRNLQNTDTAIRQLQESIDRCLSTDRATALRGVHMDGALPPHATAILAAFDRAHHTNLQTEAKRLADGGNLTMSGTVFPSIIGRAVVREAAIKTDILRACKVVTDIRESSVMLIPYMRREGGTLMRRGITYEGQPMPRISFRQSLTNAPVLPVRFSIVASHEVLHFTGRGNDAAAMEGFINTASEQFREVMVMRIADEMARAADAYGATSITDEDISSQLNGTRSLIKTSVFPLVRPFQRRSLAGDAIDDEQNPILLTVNNSAVSEWDASGSQSSGIYYRIDNATLGYLRLVDEAGDPVTPTASGTCTISYSASSNRILFDRKLPASTRIAEHYDGVVTAIAAAKATIFQRTQQTAGYCALAGTLADEITDAAYFAGSDARTEGLSRVKGLDAYAVDVPDCDLNSQRIIVGVDEALTYGVAKPLTFAPPFGLQGKTERATYGEEYSTVHVPDTIYNRLTSVVVYDSDARTAAV